MTDNQWLRHVSNTSGLAASWSFSCIIGPPMLHDEMDDRTARSVAANMIGLYLSTPYYVPPSKSPEEAHKRLAELEAKETN